MKNLHLIVGFSLIIIILLISIIVYYYYEETETQESSSQVTFRQTDTSDVVDATGDKITIKGNYYSTGITKEALDKANRLSIQNELRKMDADNASVVTYFAKAILNECSLADIYQTYLNHRAPARMPTIKQFKEKFPQYSDKEARIFLNYCQKLYEQYQNGEFDPKDVTTSSYSFPRGEYFDEYRQETRIRTTLISEEELTLREMRKRR